MKEPTVWLEDQWLGKRPMPDTPLAVIEDQHRMLCAIRASHARPTLQLRMDIAAYEAILTCPDPVVRAKEYMDYKMRPGFNHTRPRDVARAKGWMK